MIHPDHRPSRRQNWVGEQKPIIDPLRSHDLTQCSPGGVVPELGPQLHLSSSTGGRYRLVKTLTTGMLMIGKPDHRLAWRRQMRGLCYEVKVGTAKDHEIQVTERTLSQRYGHGHRSVRSTGNQLHVARLRTLHPKNRIHDYLGHIPDRCG